MYSESMPQPVLFANFEDFVTANAHSGGAIYQVTIGRMRRPAAGGGCREPIYPWEAKDIYLSVTVRIMSVFKRLELV